MKYILFLILSLLLVSCSDDDSNNTNTQSTSLIGTWKGISFTREDNGITYDTSSCENLNTMASYRTFVFIDQSSLHYSDTCTGGNGNDGTYTYNDNVLTFDLGDGIVECDVAIISSSKLSLNITGYGTFILEKL